MEYSKIKKVRIPQASLPAIEAGRSYYVRFRIKTDDDNMKSHWSWVYTVTEDLGKINILDGGEIQ